MLQAKHSKTDVLSVNGKMMHRKMLSPGKLEYTLNLTVNMCLKQYQKIEKMYLFVRKVTAIYFYLFLHQIMDVILLPEVVQVLQQILLS